MCQSFEDQKIRLPTKELLLMHKALAYRNREDRVRMGHLRFPRGEKEWFERKIAKDKEDIRNLIESRIDYGKLDKLLKQTKFRKVYEESLNELGIR